MDLATKLRCWVSAPAPYADMITRDPTNGHSGPDLMRRVACAHHAKAGAYGAVRVEGTI